MIEPRLSTVPAPPPAAPSDQAWEQLLIDLAAGKREAPIVDVIVPVYRGFDESANCLYTVLRSLVGTSVPCEPVVVDDESPDPELSRLLNRLADRGLFTLLRNEKNAGFVASTNRGMTLHGDRDVILLTCIITWDSPR